MLSSMRLGAAERAWASREHPNVLYRGHAGGRQITVRAIEAFHGPVEAKLTNEQLKGLSPQQRAERKILQNAYHAMNDYFGGKGEGIPIEALHGALNMPREAGKTVFLVAHDENGKVLSYASAVHHEPTKTAVLGYIWSHPGKEFRGAKLEGSSKSLAHLVLDRVVDQLKNGVGTRNIYAEIEPFTPKEQRDFSQLKDLNNRSREDEQRFQELYYKQKREKGEHAEFLNLRSKASHTEEQETRWLDLHDRLQRMKFFDKWGAQHIRMTHMTPNGEGNTRMNAIVLAHEGLPALNARNFLQGVRGVQSLIYSHFPASHRQRAYAPMADFARRLGQQFRAKTFTLQPVRNLLKSA